MARRVKKRKLQPWIALFIVGLVTMLPASTLWLTVGGLTAGTGAVLAGRALLLNWVNGGLRLPQPRRAWPWIALLVLGLLLTGAVTPVWVLLGALAATAGAMMAGLALWRKWGPQRARPARRRPAQRRPQSRGRAQSGR